MPVVNRIFSRHSVLDPVVTLSKRSCSSMKHGENITVVISTRLSIFVISTEGATYRQVEKQLGFSRKHCSSFGTSTCTAGIFNSVTPQFL